MAFTRVLTAVAVTAPIVALTACSPDQEPAAGPGTTPAVVTPSSSVPPAATAGLVAHLATADGTPVADATFDFTNGPNGADGYVTITVETTADGVLEPGFHHMHIHAVGQCEPDSVGPDGGEPGDFLSAGPHYQSPGRTAEPPSGDLPALLVRDNGAALLVVATDLVNREELVARKGTSLMLHGAEGATNAHDRVACGVIEEQ